MSLDAWSWPSRLSRPHCPLASLYLSPIPLQRGERGGAGRQHGHLLLQWSPRRHSPFHHKEGVLHGHGVPAPGRLTLAPRTARTANAAHPTRLARPPAPRPGGPGASERASRGALARHGSGTWSAPQTESLTLLPGPAAAPSPGSSQRVRPPGSAPGLLSLRQSRTPSAAPLPHPCSRDQTRPRPLSAGHGHLVTRPWRRGSRGGGGGRVFSRLAPQDSGGGAACSLAGKAVGFPRYAVVPALHNPFTFPLLLILDF